MSGMNRSSIKSHENWQEIVPLFRNLKQLPIFLPFIQLQYHSLPLLYPGLQYLDRKPFGAEIPFSSMQSTTIFLSVSVSYTIQRH